MSTAENTAATVQVDFTLEIGERGRLQACARVPAGPVSLTGLLPVFQELSSNVIEATVDNVQKEGYAISCKAGCGACCRQLVPLSLFEAEWLANWIRSLPPEQQAILETRFRLALSGLQKAGMLDRLNFAISPEPGSKEERQLALDYLHAGVACPFLQDESCGIYPIRPIVCREYLVTSPPQFCASPTNETVHVVPMPLKLSRSLVQLGSQLSAERRGWIPLVFLFSWLKSGASLGAAFEQPGPELLRVVVEQLITQESLPGAAASS